MAKAIADEHHLRLHLELMAIAAAKQQKLIEDLLQRQKERIHPAPSVDRLGGSSRQP